MEIHPLKMWLLNHGLSQREFSQRSGVHEVKLSEFLKWKKTPSLETAIKIVKATNNELKIESLVRSA